MSKENYNSDGNHSRYNQQYNKKQNGAYNNERPRPKYPNQKYQNRDDWQPEEPVEKTKVIVPTNVQNTSKGKASADFLAAFTNIEGG